MTPASECRCQAQLLLPGRLFAGQSSVGPPHEEPPFQPSLGIQSLASIPWEGGNSLHFWLLFPPGLRTSASHVAMPCFLWVN